MAKWVCETKRVRTSWVNACHKVSEDAPSYSTGQNIAVEEGLFSYRVWDGNHRLRDAVRRGDRWITVDIWRKR